MASMNIGNNANIGNDEIEKFSATGWWDNHKLYRTLHQMNPARLTFIDEVLRKHYQLQDETDSISFKGRKALDIGCGGGVLSLPLARMGFAVSAIDMNDNAIIEAKKAANQAGLTIDFQMIDVEKFANKHEETFDAVFCLELLEHIDDWAGFLESATALLKPDGMLFISTIRRDLKSKLLAIYAAEYVLQLLPKGTHDWQKFLNPDEIMAVLHDKGLRFCDSAAMVWQPIRNNFILKRGDDTPNYILAASKQWRGRVAH